MSNFRGRLGRTGAAPWPSDAEGSRQSGLIAFRPSRAELRSDQEEHVWAMDGVRHKPRPKPLYPC
jgi:hypothetical protein